MFKIEEHKQEYCYNENANHLTHNFRFSVNRFIKSKNTFKNVFPIVACKDYLQDFFYSLHTKTSVNVYGFNTNNYKLAYKPKSYISMCNAVGSLRPYNYKNSFSDEDIKKIENICKLMLKEYNIEIQVTTTEDKNHVIFIFNTADTIKCIFLSFFALIIRNFIFSVGNEENIMELFTNLSKVNSNDSMSFVTIKNNYEKNNIKDKFKLTFDDLVSRWANPRVKSNYEISHFIHNSTGILHNLNT
jgi:hypothetical protein